MPKDSLLPHLTSEELSDRDYQETLLNKELSKCWRGDEFDGERAEHVLSDYAVQIFRVIHDAYRTRPSFQKSWLEEIEQRAIYRTLKVYSGHSAYGMPTMEELEKTFREAIRVHLKNLAPLESLSPLLMMVHDAARAARPKVQAPIPTEPKRRFPSQIKSESAAQKVEAYMNSRGLNQTQFATKANMTDRTLRNFLKTGVARRSTLDGIAAAMGITKENLLS